MRGIPQRSPHLTPSNALVPALIAHDGDVLGGDIPPQSRDEFLGASHTSRIDTRQTVGQCRREQPRSSCSFFARLQTQISFAILRPAQRSFASMSFSSRIKKAASWLSLCLLMAVIASWFVEPLAELTDSASLAGDSIAEYEPGDSECVLAARPLALVRVRALRRSSLPPSTVNSRVGSSDDGSGNVTAAILRSGRELTLFLCRLLN